MLFISAKYSISKSIKFEMGHSIVYAYFFQSFAFPSVCSNKNNVGGL